MHLSSIYIVKGANSNNITFKDTALITPIHKKKFNIPLLNLSDSMIQQFVNLGSNEYSALLQELPLELTSNHLTHLYNLFQSTNQSLFLMLAQ